MLSAMHLGTRWKHFAARGACCASSILTAINSRGVHRGRKLGLDGDDGIKGELATARVELAQAALAALSGRSDPAADHWRQSFEAARTAASSNADSAALDAKRALGIAALNRQRERLEQLRAVRHIRPGAFLILQEELDFLEVSLSDEDGRRIEQS
jgi:CPA1 family monovalent cation:H+ antiporter